ncbi:saccharopine dehydrogenase [Endogone sp. FLAS-F59071]|nr:saccharopine dehydrogenase [Endogone sp. FLAS-F59071]|eukprot:RUS21077.1 saccharopine dehydrogenase [Endogone sp. FLAS-F59071]
MSGMLCLSIDRLKQKPLAPNLVFFRAVLFGATGFTGALAAEHLARTAPNGLKWALAGRTQKKLDDVKQGLLRINDSLKVQVPPLSPCDCTMVSLTLSSCIQDLPTLIADSNDLESLDAITRETRVVVSTIGPFVKYGTPLVDSCVRNKTHYLDITGEIQWVNQIIKKYHDTAVADGTILVPCCAFDSVPSDLGAFMVVDYIHQKFERATEDVKFSLTRMTSKAPSGGTIASMLEFLATSSDPNELTDPYLVSPVRGVDKFAMPTMYYDRDFGGWQASFLMSAVNERIVRRSFGLKAASGESYGKLFKYHESMTASFFVSVAITIGFIIGAPILVFLLKIPFLRNAIQKMVTQPGTGPSREELDRGSFEVTLVANADTEPYEDHIRVIGKVKGFHDPGYVLGSMMVVEGALAILYDKDHIPGKGGILTPATALGYPYMDRLKKHGMVFEVQRL